MSFLKYPKIHRLDKVDEVGGILDGKVYVQEKIDGANASIWLEEGRIRVGSRNNDISDTDNLGGFHEWVMGNNSLMTLVRSFPEGYRFYAEWLCLSGDTKIKKVSGGKSTKGNYMTLREMYRYLNTPLKDRRKSWWQKNGMPSIYSLHKSKDRIFPNKIKKIKYTGEKFVYILRTREGKEIKSTKEHKFYTNFGYVPLEEIMKNIKAYCLAISDLKFEKQKPRNLGVGSRKILKRQSAFKKRVGECRKCGSIKSLELDHIDEDFRNNNESNWQVLCAGCHKNKSALNRRLPHSKGYPYRFDKIESIKPVGIEDTYDIEMEGEEDLANFVANGFLVHNCKHTINYAETAYRNFYLFDIFLPSVPDNDDLAGAERFSPEEVEAVANEHGVSTPTLFAVLEQPTLEMLRSFLGKSVLGEKGEGIVLRNMEYVNKFGRKTYAKLVTEEFVEDNKVMFGGNNRHSTTYWETWVVNKYMTVARIRKVMSKIQSLTGERMELKHTPRVAGTAYHDMLEEEIWEISKKVVSIDFKALNRIAHKKAIAIYKDILRDDLSVAFN